MHRVPPEAITFVHPVPSRVSVSVDQVSLLNLTAGPLEACAALHPGLAVCTRRLVEYWCDKRNCS